VFFGLNANRLSHVFYASLTVNRLSKSLPFERPKCGAPRGSGPSPPPDTYLSGKFENRLSLLDVSSLVPVAIIPSAVEGATQVGAPFKALGPTNLP